MQLDSRLQTAAKLHIPNALFVTVSGAHLYGFSSPDSDYDLRGSHAAPIRDLVGLFPARETIEVSEVRDGLEWDIVSHEARKFCALIAKDSGYALEQLCSPLIVITSPAHEELKAIALDSLNRKFARHYLGFADNQWRLFLKDSPPRVKPLLYIYRVLLTGAHLLQTGKLEANLPRLNEDFGSATIRDLIDLKLNGVERQTLGNADLPFYEAEYARLRERLENAEHNSPLPPEVDIKPALHDWLIRLRLG